MAHRVVRTGFVFSLCGVATDRHGRLYAAGDSEVRVFDGAGVLERRWKTSKPALSVAVARDGSVSVGEAGQIEIFDGGGRLLGTWCDGALLGRVTSIGFVKDSVLAADAADRAIRRFDVRGKFLNNIGKDNRLNGFHIPNGVVDFDVDARGVIHAANPGRHRVERYTAEGELVGHFGRFHGTDPAGFGGCCNPTNVAVSTSGAVCVTEKAGPRAKVYDAAGKLLSVIASDLFDPNAKNMDVAVDRRGGVYVADPVKLAIFVFEGAAS